MTPLASTPAVQAEAHMADTDDSRTRTQTAASAAASDTAAAPPRRLTSDGWAVVIIGSILTLFAMAIVALGVHILNTTNTQFAAIDQRFTAIDQRFIAQDARIDQRFAVQDAKIDRLETKIDRIELKLTALIAGLEMTEVVDTAIERPPLPE